jgi:hypothetical protein
MSRVAGSKFAVTASGVYDGDVPVEPDRYEPLPSLLELPGFLIRKLTPRRRRLAIAAGALLLAALVLAAVLVVPQLRADSSDRQAEEAHRAAVANANLKARYAREARPVQGTGPAVDGRRGAAALAARRRLVGGMQAAVLADARERTRRGELHARYASATCYGYPKQVHERPPADDLNRPTAVLECLAVAAKVARDTRTTTGSLIGQPYRARVDFTQGRYAFCKIVQQPGELAIQRESVLKVPTACGGKP